MLSSCSTFTNSTVPEQVASYSYTVAHSGDLHQNGCAAALLAALLQGPVFTSHLTSFDLFDSPLFVQCRHNLVNCTFKETIKNTEIRYLFVKMPVLRIIENPIILTNKSMLILFSMSFGYQVYCNRGSYDKKINI